MRRLGLWVITGLDLDRAGLEERVRELACSVGASRAGSVGRGPAPMQAGTGVPLVFATGPGAPAADGDGRDGPVAEALLAHLETPGPEARRVMTRVRRDVLAKTAEP